VLFRQIAALIKSTIPKEKQAGTSSVLPASCNAGFSFHFHKNQPFEIAKNVEISRTRLLSWGLPGQAGG